MQKKTRVHIISHSHWEREWYLPLERHKMRLLDLIDDNMELFENDPEFKSFHLDGQTIVLDDYLEIKPQNKEKIEKYAREGRFRVGPFYILQDEFLTSGEANVRNLQTGIREAKAYGNLTKVGYFPDAFGNAGQMPQLLNQAGVDSVAFGRGVKPVGFNNEVLKNGKYESAFSEMMWESPDGTAILGILFANWYHNGQEIPVDEAEAKAYWDDRLPKAEMFASTKEILFMNGCDHQPVQTDLSATLETARKLYPDVEFVHSNFEDYIQCIKDEVENQLSTVKGELTSQETDGWYTLVNTCSSHVYLKRLNRKNEVALEQLAEPISAWASVEGQAYPHDKLQYAWKILMQNHPHDSICGCSVDPVNKEMEIRFDRSTEIAKVVTEDAAEYLAARVNTAQFKAEDLPFVVFNTSGWEKNASVSVVLDIVRDRHRWIDEGYYAAKALKLPSYIIVDENGNQVEATIEDIGVKFGFELPRQSFRRTYMARQVKVTMFAKELPACGYKTYALRAVEEEKGASAGAQVESTGVQSASAGVQSASAGAQVESAGAQSASAGVQVESAGVQSASAGVQSASAGAQVESAGVQSASAGVQVESAGVQNASAGASACTESKSSLVTGTNQMENEYLSVAIAADGTLIVNDKVLNRSYENLCYFEDTMDAGNEYIYFCPPGNPAITTQGTQAQIRLVQDTSFAACYEICHELQVPVSADEQLLEDQRSVLEFKKRRCHRSAELTTLKLYTYVTLEKGARDIKFRTEFDNNVKDHRLRVIVPTNLAANEHYAETVFESVKRPNEHSVLWENPCKCEHQQSYVGMNDEKGGILVANIGLYEYEMLPEQNNAMAVTLVRCVGEMGDWGVFPTELSQQQRHITNEYALVFYSGDLIESGAFRYAHQFQVPVQTVQTSIHAGELPLTKSFLQWEAEGIALTNLKVKDGGTDRMARFVNYGAKEQVLTIKKDAAFAELYRSNIVEEELAKIDADSDGTYKIKLRGYEILTVGMR